MSARLQAGVLALLLGALVIVYLPAMAGGFIWDDLDYVEENESLRSLKGLGRIWTELEASPQYYPLVFTSFWAEFQVYGLDPRGYHLVNVLLHAVNSFLLWRLLRVLSVPGAGLAAGLFALHPVQVESVAWITERKNLLSGLFFFLTALAWLRFRGLPPATSAVRRGTRYAWVVLFFVSALLSKTATCTLPIVLLLVIWWQEGRISRRDLFEIAPLLALSVLTPLVTLAIESGYVAVEGGWGLTWSHRLWLVGRAFWFYAAKLAWPLELIFIYPRWDLVEVSPRQYLGTVALVLVLAIFWLARDRIGRGPLACMLAYAVMLAPTLGFADFYFMRYSFVADHFQYLAMIGPVVLFSASAASLAERWPRAPRRVAQGAALVLLVALALVARERSRVYVSEEILWRDTIVRNPSAWMAWNNLGQRLLLAGRAQEAIPLITRAIELQSESWEAYGGLADAYKQIGRPELAQRVYELVAERVEAVSAARANREALDRSPR
jgi:hypothetical protein